ncbi:MAG: hypothetical protein D6707_09280 [Bacteroidetes bacterium]|nr:MAG: hypothetical protein D6707_09280 [Bacteroidota bacterium]
MIYHTKITEKKLKYPLNFHSIIPCFSTNFRVTVQFGIASALVICVNRVIDKKNLFTEVL